MADKTYEIEVKTTANTEGVTSVKDALTETKTEAEETREALESAFSDATAEVERLEEALNEALIDHDDSAIEEIDLALIDARERAEELEEQLNNFDASGIDNTKDSVDGLNESLQETNGTAESVGANMGLIDSAVMMDMSNQISSLGGSAEGMAQTVEQASISVGQLSKNVGVAEPSMVNMIAHISNATFPQNEAMAYVNALNQMGVSSDKLGDSATNMDKINDATGIGYQKVMQLTQGLRAIGVSADNLPSSFNAISYAQGNVTGGADTLTNVLGRQAPTLKEYGLNVDQTAILLSKMSEMGYKPMKMGSELSKILKDNNGDLSAVEQQLGLTSGALSNAGEITGQYDGQLQSLADEEAQHKTLLEQVGAMWEDVSLKMSGVIGIGGSVAGIIGQIGSTALSINSIVQLADNFKKWDRLRGIFQGVNEKLNGLRGGFSRVMTASKNAIISVGNFAKTLLTSVVSAVRTAVTWLGNLARSVLTAGYNALKSGAMWLVNKARVVATTLANWALAISEWAVANPILIIVGVILILIGVLAYLYFNNEQVRNSINNLGQTLYNIGGIIYGFLVQAFNTIVTTLQGVWNYITTLGGLLPQNVAITGNNIIDTVIRVMTFIATLPIQLGIIFINTIAKVLGFGDNFVQNMIKAGSQSVTKFFSYITQIPSKLATELGNALNKVNEWASTLPAKFWEAGVNAVKQFLSALGIASPGTMQRMLVWEINEMGNRIPKESETLLSNISRLGSDVVDEFGNPRLDIQEGNFVNGSLHSTSNNDDATQVNHFYFNDTVIDNDERMEKICDYITKKIAWDNKTAGRTI